MKMAVKKLVLSVAAFAVTSTAMAQVDEACRTVKLAEPGWTDLALTTGVTSVILKELGYEPKTDILGMSVMLEAMKNAGIDVMMGYWEPAMDPIISRYLEEGSIEKVRVSLTGAKYTYAVPDYVYDAGVTRFEDLATFADKFDKRLYGIEPGSNELVIAAVERGDYGLKGWKVIESSEQGMLSQVDRYVRQGKWIAFQAWEPHPMNTKYNFRYLSGGDALFGPDFGGAQVHSTVRKGYLDECPNVGQLVKNLSFDLSFENEGMGFILDEGLTPEQAARKIIKKYPENIDAWLEGVYTINNEKALDVVKSKLM